MKAPDLAGPVAARTSLEPAGFFAIRTPLLPFDALLAWAEGPAGPGADRDALRARQRAFVARPDVREALFVASPSLEREIAHWRGDPDGERGQRIERALVRYVLRMAGRPTPFGLFAGSGVGEVVARTELYVPPTGELRRRTRLDQGFVSALTQALGADRALRRTRCFRANETAYAAAGRLRYFEARGEGARRTYHLVAVDPGEALEAALGRARHGAPFDAIAGAINEVDASATRDEAEAFVDELIDAQLLLDELAPAVVGSPSLAKLAESVGGARGGRAAAERLTRVEAGLRAIDEAGLGHPPERYAPLVEELAPLPARPDPAFAFQVDLVKPGDRASLSEGHAREIARGAALLCRLGRPHRTAALERFKVQFQERFGEAEVPLLVALDDDVGVGFDERGGAHAGQAPLLEGLPFPGTAAEGDPRWRPAHDVLLRKWEGALRVGAREIVLGDADLDALAGPAPAAALPEGFAAVVSLLAAPFAPSPGRAVASPFAPSSGAHAASLDGAGGNGGNGGDDDVRVFVRAVTGSSGASLLARFADADPGLLARLRGLVEREEAARPDVLFAEIAHLPPGRVGNILLRPRLRRHELPALGRVEGPETTRLALADLFVCVRDGRVVLRSARLGREIVPRLTTAHRFDDRSNLTLYRFLASLQFEGITASLSWSWGPLASAEFLPRV
ncbi:MAG TPA: lantibiotic dehydratase family protein, partial [Polyangiaceae bacterium]|nr:lantibiotic dehydratase family protein [Polyangiaceae bacterium]